MTNSEGGSAPLPIPPPETAELRRRSRRSNKVEQRLTHIRAVATFVMVAQRSFKVVRARSASMNDRIQKRTMILGSAHPFIS